ncbi:MAG TPA: heat-inducible transcription repressor HrcA [Dehalococcoidia bacterium]|nr:heat-inducible transcription repressor HrcA [Dehalococcoidia bacterium]
MLTTRSGRILNSIVQEYIIKIMPVPSQFIASDISLGVSPATVRNEMAHLEREGYLIRPHTSAGCLPSDKGYRFYVESIQNVTLPYEEQRLISHTFHQAEREIEVWLSLSATLLARLAQNMAVVSKPKSTDCRLKHLELLSLQETMALAVIVLHGAKVKQKLITFKEGMSQAKLTVTSNKLNSAFADMTGREIEAKEIELIDLENEIVGHLVEIMKAEDQQEYAEPYLDGWHFMINQPEFAHSDRVSALMELTEQRGLLKVLAPAEITGEGVHVIIGKENRSTAMQNCSVVVCRYGLPGEATGTIGVVGPTRMAYSRTIPTVYYLSSILSKLVASLYGRDINRNREEE